MRGIWGRALAAALALGLLAGVGPEALTGSAGETGMEIILIDSYPALADFARRVNGGGTAFTGEARLTADIFCEGPVEPIGGPQTPFQGVFDGRGHTVEGLETQTRESFAGLFGYVGPQGTVKDITVKGARVSGPRYVGLVAAYSAGTLLRCTAVGGAAAGTGRARYGAAVGGVVGLSCGRVLKCASLETRVSGGRRVGGVVGGQCAGEVEGCLAVCEVTSRETDQAMAGGVVGCLQTGGRVRSCVAAGKVEALQGRWVGGVAGALLSGGMTGCVALGKAEGREAGALIGFSDRRAQVILCRYPAGSQRAIGEGRASGVRALPLRWREAGFPAERALRILIGTPR